MTSNSHYYALTFVATDAKGIVASVTKVLFEHGFNIADSSSTLLHGVFSMILIVTSKNDCTISEIENMFKNTNFKPNVFKYSDIPRNPEGESYSISVYGADKPGIVHEITSIIAKNDINIVDLQTKVTGRGGSEVYIMIFEVIVPTERGTSGWEKELSDIAANIGTDVTITKIEAYEF